MLAVPLELPVRSLRDPVALVPATPGKYAFGCAGTGGTQHLAGELFKSMTKLALQHVPDRRAAPVITDFAD